MPTYTILEVPGSKRKSDRVYTHAVIAQDNFGQYNFDAELERHKNIQTDIRGQWAYARRCAECKAGDDYKESGCHFPVTEEMIVAGKDFMVKYPTQEAYVTDLRETNINNCLERKEKEEGRYRVLRWSQSAVDAHKGISEFTWGYKNIKVVEVQVIKK